MTESNLRSNEMNFMYNQRSIPSNPIEYLVYYERKPNIRRPMAVLSGTDWTQTNSDSTEISKYVRSHGIISINLNNGQQEIETHLTQVKHSNDLLIIYSKKNSFIYINGEKGDGLKVGSKALIKIAGIVEVKRKDETFVLEGGRHTIEPMTGDLNFIICDERRVVLIGSDFQIDDESYLDRNPNSH